MPIQFPAFCPSCGLIYQSNALVISGNVTGLVMSDNRETCPRCGNWAELPDGTFNVTDDTIEVLEATDLTRERLANLASILDDAKRGVISDEAAAAAVIAEAPSLQPLIARLQPKMQHALILFLWAVFQILASQVVAEHFDHSATKADVQQAVDQAVKEYLK
ncbi:MAG: hypothetical protein WAO61_01285 [Solirubrobacterales bacterium]